MYTHHTHTLLAVVCAALVLHTATAFDTGYHADLIATGAACVFGTGPETATTQLATLGMWYVEYGSYYGSVERAGAPAWTGALQRLHGHGLASGADVLGFVAEVEEGTLGIVAANSSSGVEVLLAAGVGAHAVADVYAHSTWVETHPRNASAHCGACVRTDTMGAYSAADIAAIDGLYSGDAHATMSALPPGARADEWELRLRPLEIHGDYCRGVAKDSANRPLFRAAYGFALAATIEYFARVKEVLMATQPSLWADVSAGGAALLSPSQATDVAAEIAAMRDIAVFAGIPSAQDGQWKGSGSALGTVYASIEPDYFAAGWDGIAPSRYPRPAFAALAQHPLFTAMTDNLYPASGVWPAASGWPGTRQAYAALKASTCDAGLVVRSVAANKVGPGTDTGAANSEDMFVRVTHVGTVVADEAPVLEADSVANVMWATVLAAPSASGTLDLDLQLYNDNGLLGNAHAMSIGTSGADGHLALTVDPLTGAVTGDATGTFDSTAALLTATGTEGALSLYIRPLALGCPLGPGIAPAVVPNGTLVRDAAVCPAHFVQTATWHWCPPLPLAPTPPAATRPKPPCNVLAHHLIRKPYWVIGLQILVSSAISMALVYLKISSVEQVVEERRGGGGRRRRRDDPPPRYEDVVDSSYDSYYYDEEEEEEEEATTRRGGRVGHRRGGRDRRHESAPERARRDKLPTGRRMMASYVIEMAQVAAQIGALVVLYAAYRDEKDDESFSRCSGWYQYEVVLAYLAQTSFLSHGLLVRFLLKNPLGLAVVTHRPLQLGVSIVFFGGLFVLTIPWLVTHLIPAAIIFFPVMAAISLLQLVVHVPIVALRSRIAAIAPPPSLAAATATAVETLQIEVEYAVAMAASRAVALPLLAFLPGVILHFYHGAGWRGAIADDYAARSTAAYFSSVRESFWVFSQAAA